MRYIRTLALVLVGVLLTAACSTSSSTDSGEDPPADDDPQAIVSLSPTATEMLFAIGAGDQVVAVDDQSDFPADVPRTDLSGFEVNVEAVLGYEPDLVVASDDAAADGLAAAGVTLLVLPAAGTLTDVYDQLVDLGEATGHEDEAAEVAADMRTEIDEITASVASRASSPTYYHELDDTYYTVTSSTFIGQLYALAGAENIADAADTDGSGYPQLSAEFIIAEDPDLIFLADTECCGQSATTVAARPGWGELRAVKSGDVIALDDDVASRWGPRIVDLLRQIVHAVSAVPAA